MNIYYVYHVVTERPMILGQSILLDENNHNGVYDRVMAFKGIIDGEEVCGAVHDLIRIDMDKWGKVAYRELALEKVRKDEYCNYPSRLACLYTSRTLEEAKRWSEFFQRIDRKVYSIVKLKVEGNVYDGDARNCFDGTLDEEENMNIARLYWKSDINETSIVETLVDGDIKVIEIVEEYQ